MAGKADGSIIIDTQVDTKGISSGISAIESKFSKLMGAAKMAGAAIAAAFAIKQLVAFSKECIEVGSALAEVQNVVDVTFGDMRHAINDWAKNSAESFGLSELAAKQYASTMGAMIKSMGFTGDAVATMSVKMAELAGDMASFYNLDTDTAFQKIRSGISGETEPLKQLGINLSEANLEQFRMAEGIKTSYKRMNQQQKALLRYHYLLKVTSDAQGDFARTSGSWANQTRILSLRLQSIKADLGQGLINLFLPVLKLINKILKGLEKLASAFRAFTNLITGKKEENPINADLSIDETADGYENIAAAIDSYAGAMDDETESMEASNDATQEAIKLNKKYLSGLDQIHKFTTDNDNSSQSANIPPATSGAAAQQANIEPDPVDFGKLADGQNILDKTAEKTNTLFNMILSGVPKVIAALGNLALKGFGALGSIAIDGLASAVSLLLSLLTNLGKVTLDGLASALSAITRIALDGLTNSLSLLLSIIRSLAEVSVDAVLQVLSRLAKLGFQGLAEGLSLVLEALRDIGSITLSAITEALTSLSRIAFHGLETALTAVTELLGALAAHVLSAAISELTSSLERLQKVNWNSINTSLKNLKTALDDFSDNMGEGLKWFFDNALSKIDDWEANEAFTTFMTQISVQFAVMASMIGVLQPFWEWAWTNMFEKIRSWDPGKFLSASEETADRLGAFSDWCKDIPDIAETAIAAISGFFDSWDQINAVKGKLDILRKIVKTRFIAIKNIIAVTWSDIGIATNGSWMVISKDLMTAWDNLKLWCKTKFNGILDAVSVTWNVVGLITTNKWSSISDEILSVWKDGIFASIVKYLDYIRSRMSRRWETINTEAGDGWDIIKRTITIKAIKIANTVISAFGGMYKSATNSLIDLGDNVAKLFNNMLQNAITLSDYIIDMMNYLDSAAFGSFAIGRILQGLGFSWKPITQWGLGIPLMAFSYASSHIPRLASGAVIPPNMPFLAQLGDQKHGTNIEAPLDTIKQAMREAGGGNQPIHIQMYLDGRVVYDTVIRRGKQQQQMGGVNPFELA